MGKIIFSTKQDIFVKEINIKNVSNIFFDNNLLYGLNVYSNIDKLDKGLTAIIKTHLNQYYKTILEISKKLNTNLINEDQIIKYLNNNQELKKQYQMVFEDEIEIVKQYAPNIVESWVYYKKFNEGDKNEYP